MAFIRIKNVKKWKYAYLVENTWKSQKTRQKVKRYLGRVHKLENMAGAKFEKDIDSLGFKEAVTELVKFELLKAGFSCKGSILVNEGFSAEFDKAKFMSCNKPVVFESNEGFICSHTFSKLANFKPYENEEETALRLAESVLDAGISIPHPVFVKLFEKMHKSEMHSIENFENSQKFINNTRQL